MSKILIISSSVRTNRNSHRVALYFQNYLAENHSEQEVEIIDLEKLNFPIFEERLSHQKSPAKNTLEFAEKIVASQGIIIVTPEYNGGYPASLKNAIDLLHPEWRRKPIAISTVSDGVFGGSQVITSLQFVLWKIRSWVVPAQFPVPSVKETFDEKGKPSDPKFTNKNAKNFVDELLWCMEANEKMSK
jgi:NAD(P)H-dependent FMN reductase